MQNSLLFSRRFFFHSSSNDPIFPKEKSQFQFLRQRTQVQFDPLFKKKKKKLSFLLGRTIEDHPSRFYPNLSSRTTINNIIFNKATTSSRIRFICDKISSSPPNWNLINILIRDEVNRSRQNFPPKEIGTRGWFLPPVGVQRCITTSPSPLPYLQNLPAFSFNYLSAHHHMRRDREIERERERDLMIVHPSFYRIKA